MSVICLRCGIYQFTPYGEERDEDDPWPPALSRTTRGADDEPAWVCSACGTDEAMIEYRRERLQPREEWPVALQFNMIQRR